jgi:hypothetical protein
VISTGDSVTLAVSEGGVGGVSVRSNAVSDSGGVALDVLGKLALDPLTLLSLRLLTIGRSGSFGEQGGEPVAL